MGRTTARIFVVLFGAAVPPLAAFALWDRLAPEMVADLGSGTALAIAVLASAGWMAVVATIVSRVFDAEARRMVRAAERGTLDQSATREGTQDVAGEAHRRLTAALDERNRQIAELAAQSRTAPIALDAAAVARAMVAAAAQITGDPTWTLAVTRSRGDAITAGSYGPDTTEPLAEVHRWASTVDRPHAGGVAGVGFATGPWGAFVVAEVASSDELHATLLAPWEGRDPPSQAERELLRLVGQHAGMAIEHALLYDRVRSQADELDRLAKLQGDFLRGVSHDLQTPLTSIRALAHEVGATASLDADARSDLDAIGHQTDRLRRMVAQLLAMSRLESGVLTARSDVFSIAPIVERTWAALRAGRPFELAVDGEPHLAVGDPDRFEQALWAVLDNAVKYSPAGSRIAVRIVPATRGLAVRITDLGRGMSPATTASAFDQFYRSPDARDAVPDGSGIGLYTARGLLRAMDGDITIESRLAHGTVVSIHVPAELAATQA